MLSFNLRSSTNPGPPALERPLEPIKSQLLNLNNLPMLPEVAIRAVAMSKDPDCSLQTLAGLIERDPALATGILRLANSPFYRTGKAIDSLGQSVIRLGLRECQNLILTVSLRNLFRTIPASKRKRCEALWQHSYVAAALCRLLNRNLQLGFSGQEFAAGICHDLGRLLMVVGAPAYFDLADPLDFKEPPSILSREREIMGTDHSELGAWFTQLNELPETVVVAIRHHHAPANAHEYSELVGLVALADDMANHLQRRETVEKYDATAHPAWEFVASLWTEKTIDELQQQAPALMAEVARDAEGAVRFS